MPDGSSLGIPALPGEPPALGLQGGFELRGAGGTGPFGERDIVDFLVKEDVGGDAEKSLVG